MIARLLSLTAMSVALASPALAIEEPHGRQARQPDPLCRL